MRISDWSSDVCSSDLLDELLRGHSRTQAEALRARLIEASAPAALVERIVALSALDGAVGIADLSASLGRTHDEMAPPLLPMAATPHSELPEPLGTGL